MRIYEFRILLSTPPAGPARVTSGRQGGSGLVQSPQSIRRGTNGLAITSLISGILAWVLTLLLACLNIGIIPFLAVATFGVGGLLYFCTLAAGCLAPPATSALWRRNPTNNPGWPGVDPG